MIRKSLIAMVAGAMLAAPAFAQAIDAQIELLVVAWIEDEAPDFSPVVKDYGRSCITPIISAMTPEARGEIIAAGGIAEGLDAIAITDQATVDALMPDVQECVETLFVGETIWVWVQGETTLTDEDKALKTVCFMDAIRSLPSDAKQAIVAARNFEVGVRAIIQAQPAIVGDLDARLEACDVS